MAKVAERHLLIAWFLFWLGATIFGAIAGFMAGAFAGVLVALLSIEFVSPQLAGGMAGFIVGIPVSYICFRLSVMKYLLPRAEVQGGSPYRQPEERVATA
jgi:Na+/proline symporter